MSFLPAISSIHPNQQLVAFSATALSLGMAVVKSYDFKKTVLIVASVAISIFSLPALSQSIGLRMAVGVLSGLVFGAYAQVDKSSIFDSISKLTAGVLLGGTLAYISTNLTIHSFDWIFELNK